MGVSRFFRRAQWDKERAQELQDYLAHEIDDNIDRGMSPVEARRAAQRKLGNPTRIREEIYEMNTISFLDTIWQDLRYGTRILRKNPTFSLVAILTLALGTGANAAIFQLVNALRLRSLPVEKPNELVSIGIDMHGKGRVGRGYRGPVDFHRASLAGDSLAAAGLLVAVRLGQRQMGSRHGRRSRFCPGILRERTFLRHARRSPSRRPPVDGGGR